MLTGVGLVALPAGMLAARFGDKLREQRRRLDAHVQHALADGIIDSEELEALADLATQLELKAEDLSRNIELLYRGQLSEKCPHCGEPLEKNNQDCYSGEIFNS